MEAYFWKGTRWILARKGLDIHRYGFVAELRLKRHSEYFVTNLVIPLFAIVLTGFLVVFVPADSGNRIDLSVNVLLGFTFVQTIISALLPKTDQIPLLAKYVVSVLLLSVLSVAFNVLIFAVSTRPPQERPPLPLVPFSTDPVVILRNVGTFVSARVHCLLRSARKKLPVWWAGARQTLHSACDRVRISLMQRFGFLWDYLYIDSTKTRSATATTSSSPFREATRTTRSNRNKSDINDCVTVKSLSDKENECCNERSTFRLPTASANDTSLDRFMRSHFGRRHSVASVVGANVSCSHSPAPASPPAANVQRSDRSERIHSERSVDFTVLKGVSEISWRQMIKNLNILFTGIYLCSHALAFLLYFKPLLAHWFALAIDRGNWWEGH